MPFSLPTNTLIKMNTKAVIYARVSSVGDRQNTDRQISDLLDYVEYQKLELSKVFEEHISGAKKNSERPVLQQAIEYCKSNGVAILLVSELSRLGRNAFEVLATVKDLIDSGINLYMQKEQLTLLDAEGKPTMFAPIMIATLSTCAQLERENIKFRLNSGRKLYIERGGKLGRKVGSIKTTEQKREEYGDIISYLKRGYSVRNVAKLTSKGISTVQRIKTEFAL
jgi:DNA invertase Pin-like site-specific DNA recombinase